MKTDITPLWEKHFGNVESVSLSKAKSFFEELNEICIADYGKEKKEQEEVGLQNETK